MIWLIPTFALINRLRGAGGFSGCREVSSVIWGLFSAILIGSASPVWFGVDFLFCAIAFYLFAVFGWAQYFAAFTGVWIPTEGCVKPITWLGLKLFPTIRLRGAFCMILRGVFILPWFLYIGFRLHQPYLAAGLGEFSFAIFGFIYYYAQTIANWFGGRRDAIEAAEWLVGLLFGAAAYSLLIS